MVRQGTVFKDVPYTEQQIRNIFKGFDLNGDGKLSWEEVKAAFAKLGAFLPDYRAWRGRSCADADKDGFISLETELNELVTYTHKLQYKPNRSN
ncbi:putative EF-hand domain pair protein [Rosa chinensis]|uniref:Putative EF-hand domain pair protein n=1 Tax=Rosa chinensis TaxID=74649 RepID=A0A2P6PSS7_ROSCH|nr:putative EF-hand domain pair protein [Rosa chinensis]